MKRWGWTREGMSRWSEISDYVELKEAQAEREEAVALAERNAEKRGHAVGWKDALMSTEFSEAVARAVSVREKEILDWLECQGSKAAEDRKISTFYFTVKSELRAMLSSRGTPAKVCECVLSWSSIGSHHAKDCPCYEKPKPVCTCNALTRAWPVADHLPGCACYVAPQTPVLPEKLAISTTSDWDIPTADLAEAVNGILDYLRAQGVK